MSKLIKFISSRLSISLMLLSLFSGNLFANDVSPYKVLEDVGNRLFTRIADNQRTLFGALATGQSLDFVDVLENAPKKKTG